MDEQQMKDFAQRLKPETIGGRHKSRSRSDDAAMRDILSDWWNLGDFHKMTREEAVTNLVTILRDATISLKPLATNMENIIWKKSNVSEEQSASSSPLSSLPPFETNSPRAMRNRKSSLPTVKPYERPRSPNLLNAKPRAPQLQNLNLSRSFLVPRISDTMETSNTVEAELRKPGQLCFISHRRFIVWE